MVQIHLEKKKKIEIPKFIVFWVNKKNGRNIEKCTSTASDDHLVRFFLPCGVYIYLKTILRGYEINTTKYWFVRADLELDDSITFLVIFFFFSLMIILCLKEKKSLINWKIQAVRLNTVMFRWLIYLSFFFSHN